MDGETDERMMMMEGQKQKLNQEVEPLHLWGTNIDFYFEIFIVAVLLYVCDDRFTLPSQHPNVSPEHELPQHTISPIRPRIPLSLCISFINSLSVFLSLSLYATALVLLCISSAGFEAIGVHDQ